MSDQLELSHDQINAFLKRYEIFEPVLAVDSGAFGNVNANYAIETQTRRLVLQRVGRSTRPDLTADLGHHTIHQLAMVWARVFQGRGSRKNEDSFLPLRYQLETDGCGAHRWRVVLGS